MAVKRSFDVLNPIEPENGKTVWTKIGRVFENPNGTYSGQLEQVPMNGRIVMKEVVPFKDSQGEKEVAAS